MTSSIQKYIAIRLKKLPCMNRNSEKPKKTIAAYTLSIPLTLMYNRISNLFKPHNIWTIPTVNKSLTSIITRGKDKCNTLDRNNVVYKFECKDCDAVYVGETKRKLRRRRCEHKQNKNADAVINIHRKEYNHDFQWDKPKILDNEPNWGKRIISEMLHIKSHKYAINKKEDASKLSNLYLPIFKYLC